jgi:hypothetical protein
MKKIIFTAACLFIINSAFAISLVVGNYSPTAGATNSITNNAGLPIANGSGTVIIGTYLGNTPINLSRSTKISPMVWNSIVDNFFQFSGGRFGGAITGNTDGAFQRGRTVAIIANSDVSEPTRPATNNVFEGAVKTVPASDIFGKNVYILVGNGPTLKTSTEGMIYVSSYTFAADATTIDSAFLSLADDFAASSSSGIKVAFDPNRIILGAPGASGGSIAASLVPIAGPELTTTITLMPNGDRLLIFACTPGQTYQIQRSTTLMSWTTLTTGTAITDGFLSFTDALPPVGKSFYRTKLP